METMEHMLNDESQAHRHHQHDAHLIQDAEESREEGEVLALLYQRKTERYQDRSHYIGDESIGGHLFHAAPKLGGNHRTGGGTGTDDTGEHSLQEDERFALDMENEYHAYDEQHKHHLLYRHPQLPPHRSQLLEIHLTEHGEEDEEHKGWQDGTTQWRKPIAHRFQGGYLGKNEIDDNTKGYGDWQCPVFQKSYNFHKYNLFLFILSHKEEETLRFPPP